jgi:membrane protease subunit HflK
VRDGFTALTALRLTARRLAVPAATALVVLYVGSGFFSVGPGEVAVTTRFGRIVAADLPPGLHYRWPWPVAEHRLIQRDLVRRIEVGFRSAPRPDTLERALSRDRTLAGPGFPVPPAGSTGFWFQKERVPDEALLLTGDENIIEVGVTAQYRVQDPVAFAYTVADPEAVVRNVTLVALRAAVATMKVDGVYTTERGAIEDRVLRDAQALLDAYRVGVRMVAVGLLSVHAPEEVHGAFRDVASAQEDKVHIIDRATAFARETVNLAEGDAAAMVESALAFKEQKVLEAEGDALAFSLREKEYRRAPDVTRFRLHLEALEEALPPAQKILRPVGRDVKEFDLWLLQPPGGRKAP